VLSGYSEKHHIIPTCCDGSNDKNNIAILTAREHFLCHWLLYKIHKTQKLAFAWQSMSRNFNGKRYNSKSFEYAKKAWSKSMSEIHTGAIRSEETRKKQSLAKIGFKPWNCGKTYSVKKYKVRVDYEKNPIKCKTCDNTIKFEFRNRFDHCSKKCARNDKSLIVNYNAKPNSGSFKKGHEINSNTKNLISKALTGLKRPKGICPHCGKEGALSLLKRWHFDNCKILGNENVAYC